MKTKHALSGEINTILLGELNYMICCDCGLAHAFVIDAKNKTSVDLTMWGDAYLTREERKSGKYK